MYVPLPFLSLSSLPSSPILILLSFSSPPLLLILPLLPLSFFHRSSSLPSRGDHDSRVEASKMAIVAMLKSWPGVFCLCSPSNSGITSLFSMLPLAKPLVQVSTYHIGSNPDTSCRPCVYHSSPFSFPFPSLLSLFSSLSPPFPPFPFSYLLSLPLPPFPSLHSPSPSPFPSLHSPSPSPFPPLHSPSPSPFPPLHSPSPSERF